MTHPFHPLSGQQLECVGQRYNRYGTRLLLRIDENHVCSVPPQWTDVVPLDPEVVIGEGRSPFRVTDLLELADLLSRSAEQERQGTECKGNDVARVRKIPPQKMVPAAGLLSKHDLGGRTESRRALDGSTQSGVIIDTHASEIECPREPTPRTPRQRPSSRRAR